MVLNARTGQIKTLTDEIKTVGITKVHSALAVLISQMVQFLQVGKKMGELQINQTAELIMHEKAYLSIEDFEICFRRAMTGKYNEGKLYDVIDGLTIFKFINEYENERSQEAEHQSYLEHSNFKKTVDLSEKREMHPESRKIYESMMSELNAQIANEKQERLNKLGSKTKHIEVFDPAKNWFAQFDKIFLKSGTKVAGVKFISRYGLMLSMDEFLTVKQKQYERITNLKQR